jgi:hypothetical protein
MHNPADSLELRAPAQGREATAQAHRRKWTLVRSRFSTAYMGKLRRIGIGKVHIHAFDQVAKSNRHIELW